MVHNIIISGVVSSPNFFTGANRPPFLLILATPLVQCKKKIWPGVKAKQETATFFFHYTKSVKVTCSCMAGMQC